MTKFVEDAHGAVVATIVQDAEQIVEVQKHRDGQFSLIVHSFNLNTDRWDDLGATLTREQLASIGQLVESG